MSDEVRGMCQQAEQLINSRKTNEAVKLLHRAESLDPTCGEVHGYLGMASQNSGDTKQAVAEYTKALQLNPQMSFINVNLGTCYLNLSQPDQAVPYFERYLQENPNAQDAAQVRQYIQQAGSRRGQSGQSGQNNLRGIVEQGQAFLNQRRFSEAQSAFEQAIAQQPNFPPAHFYLGYALAQSGQPQRAVSEFQRALQLDPSLKEAVLNIGSNYQSLGDSRNAIAWYERYLHENPGSPKTGDLRQRISGLQQQMRQHPQMDASANDYLPDAASGGRFYRWTTMPIRVCIVSGANARGYQDYYYKALTDAFGAWALGSQNRISLVPVTYPAPCDIFCDWTDDPNKMVGGDRAVEGGATHLSAQPMPNGDGGITGATLTILTNRGGTPLTFEDMKKVCLHEVGHALGINGHSSNNQDVMFFSESPTVLPQLTIRDQATICRLYGNYPTQRPPM